MTPADPGGVDRAVAAANAGIELAPGATEGYELLGEASATRGRWLDAATAYRRCVELAPFIARHHVQLADALIRSGDPVAGVEVVDAMDRDFGNCGYTYKSYWARITTISSRLSSYPWLASWLHG